MVKNTEARNEMTKQQARRIAKAEQNLEWAQRAMVECMSYGVFVDRAIKARDKATRALMAARLDAGLES